MTTDPVILRQRLRAACNLLTFWREHARDLERRLAQTEVLLEAAQRDKASALIDNAYLRARIAQIQRDRPLNLKPAHATHRSEELTWRPLTK